MRTLWSLILLVIVGAGSGAAGWYLAQRSHSPSSNLLSPFLSTKELSLQQYSFQNLSQRQYHPSRIMVEKVLKQTPKYTSYLFSFKTLDKKMTGQLNIPIGAADRAPTIIMVRGFVAAEAYQTGVGTRNGAAYFAENGFITIAPDFFGYGESDPESSDGWQARFEKPIVIVELLKTLQAEPIVIDSNKLEVVEKTAQPIKSQVISIGKIGFWGHSNGGQIALSTLEVLDESIPTTLWAPVTVPFPYSLLYFTDEHDDEGKAMRKWISEFETNYDVFDFSLTQHLDRLQGPLQIHHGTNDDSALKEWSDEFISKINKENDRRTELVKNASASATLDKTKLQPIEVIYHIYPNADHNLQPNWQTVVDRDVEFFRKNLGN